jgi:glucose/arabinose dehydrogenase
MAPRALHAAGSAFCCLVLASQSISLPAAGAVGDAPNVPTGFQDLPVLGGLGQVMSLAFLPDGRLLFVEKAGLLRYLDGSQATTLFDISSRVRDGGEGGLLGIAVDPDFPSRPYLYFHYTTDAVSPGKVRVSRFTVTDTGPALKVDPASEVVYATAKDTSSAHNGGTVRFDSQKRLLVSLGDDGGDCEAQELDRDQGKIWRLRVDAGADPAQPRTLVPPDNPFASDPDNVSALVFVYGLRNPFRFDADRVTGDYFVGDVGETSWEEVSVLRGGENAGWPYFEGNHTKVTTPCSGGSIPATTRPAYEYPNVAPGASVMGFMLYRGKNYPSDSSFPPEYDGVFFFADYYQGFLRALKKDPSTQKWGLVPGVSATDWGTGFRFAPDMQVGPDGAAWYLIGDEIRRIVHQPGPVPELEAAVLATGLAAVLSILVLAPERGRWRSVR